MTQKGASERMAEPKRIVVLATPRYAINLNDFYMFYRRSRHELVAVLYHRRIEQLRWWINNAYPGKARDGLFDPIDFDATKFIPWDSLDDLFPALDGLEFDYLCMGNGLGEYQSEAAEHAGRERCLFAEYGWLPWHRNFYITREGCGPLSDITDMTAADLRGRSVDDRTLDALRASLDTGSKLKQREFVYVPLQTDVDDFKFTLTDFPDNRAFLDFIHEIVPPDLAVLVKRHPLHKKKKYDLKRYGRFVDISDGWFRRVNKAQLYRAMRAMVVVNSTSVIEALLFGGRVFAYGRDLFLNKDVVHFDVRDPAEFAAKLDEPVSEEPQRAFLALLLERQIDRARCLAGDLDYINNHYWSAVL